LPRDYFENKNQEVATTMSYSDAETAEIVALESVLTEEPAQDGTLEVSSDSDLRMVTPMYSTYSEQSEEDLWFDTSSLKLYASVRINETERLTKRSRIADKQIRGALEKRLEHARTLYENGVSSGDEGNDAESRAYFLESLDATEGLRVLVLMSDGNKLSDILTSFILEKLADEEPIILDEEFPLSAPGEIRGSRESPESSEDEEENDEEEIEEPSSVSEEVNTPDMDEVRKILEGIRL
jgi:hypothetical protein